MRDAFAFLDEPYYLRHYGSATVTPATPTSTVMLRQRLALASSFCPPLLLTCRVTGRWAPAECDTCIRTAAPSDPGTGSTGCWSWLPGTEKSVKSLSTLQQSYLDTVGNNANLLLNMAPDRRGLVPDSDMSAYRALGQWVKTLRGRLLRTGHPLGTRKTAGCEHCEGLGSGAKQRTEAARHAHGRARRRTCGYPRAAGVLNWRVRNHIVLRSWGQSSGLISQWR